MFYKITEEGFDTANEIHYPSGIKLTVETKDTIEENDGWEWYDEPPQEYLDWVESFDDD